jgi:HAE1 family hydrophobic/amphiphilic exporter-1
LGGILAIVILFLFLRDGRATAIIATAIPLSIICTFAPMYLGGVSLNLMSLGGLALGIGMLVDNAVVVLENIHVHRERGEDRITAAVNGTRDVSAAVVASTLTTVCVFLPITFVEGVAGQLFGDLSMTVVFSLLASLAVALFFVPMLAAQEVSLPEQKPAFKSISRAAQFSSVSQFKEAWSNKRRLLLPYWLLRMMTRLFCEVVASIADCAAVTALGLWCGGPVSCALQQTRHLVQWFHHNSIESPKLCTWLYRYRCVAQSVHVWKPRTVAHPRDASGSIYG